MPTFNGWDVITIPGTPPAPESFEVFCVDIVAMNISPFTGQQQVQNWNSQFFEMSIALPPLPHDTAQEWTSFLKSLVGMAKVFQFTSAFEAAYPNDVQNLYWRLKSNVRKWSINHNRTYGIQFDVRQAL